MAPPWQSRAKRVDGIAHRAQPARLNLSFSAPIPLQRISFSPKQLYGSVARTKALPGAPLDLVRALAASARMLIEQLVDNTPPDFAFTSSVLLFADAMRTSFSGDIGAGITDRYMESLGYVWRDNARSIVPTGEVADFVYDGPPTGAAGVVLAEAKGSITPTVTPNAIASTVSDGYRRQVEPHIGTAPHGTTILHGYAVGIASRPGDPISYIHVEEPSASSSASSGGGPASSPGGGTSGRPTSDDSEGDGKKLGDDERKDGERTGRPNPAVALGNYRSVFALIEAETVVHVIDNIRSPGERTKEKLPSQSFIRVKEGSDSYLIGVDSHGSTKCGPFAIHEKVARKFLGQLRFDSPVEKQSFNLPIFPNAVPGDKEKGSNIELFPDGLALLDVYGYGPRPDVVWDPNTGRFTG
jgi:hypothetical protein